MHEVVRMNLLSTGRLAGPLLVALLTAACAGSTPEHFRPTVADNARADDPWVEGERCQAGAADNPAVKIEQVEAGTGKPVEDGQTVRVHYVARLPDGKIVHDTHDGGPPLEMVIGSTHLVCGFEKALAGMRPGEQRRATVPWQLAFGEAGHPPDVAPKTDLTFTIDLYLPADVTHGSTTGAPRPTSGAGGRRR